MILQNINFTFKWRLLNINLPKKAKTLSLNLRIDHGQIIAY